MSTFGTYSVLGATADGVDRAGSTQALDFLAVNGSPSWMHIELYAKLRKLSFGPFCKKWARQIKWEYAD